MKGRRLALGSQNSAQAAMLSLHFLQHSDPAEPVVQASPMVGVANPTVGRVLRALRRVIGECVEVAVVHAAGVDLLGELGERRGPCRPRRRHGDLNPFDDLDLLLDLDEAVNYFDGGEPGGRCSSLVPGALTARR
jgi:hypothetical protein